VGGPSSRVVSPEAKRWGQAKVPTNLPPKVPEWMKTPGDPMGSQLLRNAFAVREECLSRISQRICRNIYPRPGGRRCRISTASSRRTDCSMRRHHAGVPTIDPAQHRLMLHGLVDKPLIFTMDDIRRFPSQSQIYFLECSGNPGYKKPYARRLPTSLVLWAVPNGPGSAWKLVLQEAGLQAGAKWVVAEGADAAAFDAQHSDRKNALMMRCWCTARTASAAPAARLPAAALAAWIRRQHEREVAAPPARRSPPSPPIRARRHRNTAT